MINKEFDLVVKLLMKPPKSRLDSITIGYSSLENKWPDIETALLAPNFKSSDDNEIKEIRIIGDEDVETRFILIPFRIGKQQIRVDFFSNGKRLGTVREDVEVLGD